MKELPKLTFRRADLAELRAMVSEVPESESCFEVDPVFVEPSKTRYRPSMKLTIDA